MAGIKRRDFISTTVSTVTLAVVGHVGLADKVEEAVKANKPAFVAKTSTKLQIMEYEWARFTKMKIPMQNFMVMQKADSTGVTIGLDLNKFEAWLAKNNLPTMAVTLRRNRDAT